MINWNAWLWSLFWTSERARAASGRRRWACCFGPSDACLLPSRSSNPLSLSIFLPLVVAPSLPHPPQYHSPSASPSSSSLFLCFFFFLLFLSPRPSFDQSACVSTSTQHSFFIPVLPQHFDLYLTLLFQRFVSPLNITRLV